MPDAHEFSRLITESVSGDRVALQRLLLSQYSSVAQHIRCRIPARMRNHLSTEDVIQQTVARAIPQIGHCSARTESSFRAWLKTIAENCVKDEIRRANSEKRGGDRSQVQATGSPFDSSLADVVELLSAGSHTPSRSAARHEAVAAVRDSIEALPDDYRRAVELRLLQGKSLREAADILGRSPRAVQGLVDRAKAKMRADLARFSS